MPDLWDTGPTLPLPGARDLRSPEPQERDRPLAPNTNGSSAGAGQRIDGLDYRTGAVQANETPSPFEQIERGLDAKLAGVYGADAVPAVRQALRDAVASEGLAAYDRFRADPGAFGEVRGDTAGVDRLGRELREVEACRALCVERGHLVPVEPAAETAPKRQALAEAGVTREPEALLGRDPEIPREHLAAWRALAMTPVPPAVLDRMEAMNGLVMDRFQQRLESRQEYVPAPSLWRPLDVREASGVVVNLDYYAVRVRMPEGVEPGVLLNHVRKNLDDFVDTSKSSFAPFSDRDSLPGNEVRWNGDRDPRTPDNPTGSFVSINIPAAVVGGVRIPGNDGSVAVIDSGRDYWTFATVQSPAETDRGDGLHPVSGNRQFGYTDNGDGTVTFYTRGVDRITDPVTQGINAVSGAIFRNNGVAFEGADALWQSFQQSIAARVRDLGGAAQVERPVFVRPDWESVSDVLTGPESVRTFYERETRR